MIEGKEVEQEWLTIIGVAADALTDGQEIIFTSYKGTDGSFRDVEILQVKKWSRGTCLIYREPRVILEKLRGKKLILKGEKEKGKPQRVEKHGSSMRSSHRLKAKVSAGVGSQF